MSTALTIEKIQGIAQVTIDVPDAAVNILSTPVMEELDEIIERLEQTSDLTAVVIRSAKASGFIAGADIREIETVTDPEQGAALAARGQKIFNRLERLKVPVVAALHGHCLGGGFELALACHYRIACDDITMSLPEVRLGILPGFGGTQRLPHLIPFETALDVILTGRTLSARKAYEYGVVDRLVSPAKLQNAAIDFAREVAADRDTVLTERRTRQGGIRNWLMKTPPGRKLVLSTARKHIMRTTKGNYPAPPKILGVIDETFTLPLEKGLEIEARALGELIVTPECKNLVHLYHLSQRHRKRTPLQPPPRPRSTAVIGAGVMGCGIAQLIAEKGTRVIVKDIQDDVVQRGIERILESVRTRLAKRGKSQDQVDEISRLVAGTTTFEGFRDVDLVVEAVIENLEIKHKVVKECEEHLRDDAILATNTSALSVTALQKQASQPQRIGGFHFFNPVERMPLVEIIQGDETADTTIDILFAFAEQLGKTPILVKDRPGFLVNRLLMAYLNEAGLLAEEGFGWRTLDTLITSFGLPMGPFRLIDEVGIDVASEVADTLCDAFPYLPQSLLMRNAAREGYLGRKNRNGFYSYPKKGKPTPHPNIDGILELENSKQPGTAEVKRMLYLMVNEAARCLEENVVDSPEDIDTGTVFGIGFPPFLGGLCRWADSMEPGQIVAELETLAHAFGERFEPCGTISRGEPFYAKTKRP